MADRPVYGTFGNNTPGADPLQSDAYKEWLRQNANNMGGGDAGTNSYSAPSAEVQAEIDRQNTMKPIVINGVEHFQLGPSGNGSQNPYDDRHVDYGKMPQGMGVTYDPTYGWVAPSSTFNQHYGTGDTLLPILAQSFIAAAAGAGAYGAATGGAEAAGAAGGGAEGGGFGWGATPQGYYGAEGLIPGGAASGNYISPGEMDQGLAGDQLAGSGATYDPVPGQMEPIKPPDYTPMVNDPIGNPSLLDQLKPYLKPGASLLSSLLSQGGLPKPQGSGNPNANSSGSPQGQAPFQNPQGKALQETAHPAFLDYANNFAEQSKQNNQPNFDPFQGQSALDPVIQALMKKQQMTGGW